MSNPVFDLLHQVAIPVIIVNEQQQIVFYNEQATHVFPSLTEATIATQGLYALLQSYAVSVKSAMATHTASVTIEQYYKTLRARAMPNKASSKITMELVLKPLPNTAEDRELVLVNCLLPTVPLSVEPAALSFALVEDIAYDGYWDWHLQEDYEYMSPRFWEILGFSPEEKTHSPKEWQALIFPEDLPQALDNYQRHIETKGKHPYLQEVRYRHKNGSTVYVSCRGKVISWDTDGTPLRMIGVHADITPLKNSEQQLSASKSFMETILRTHPDYVFVKNAQFEIVEANDLFLQCYPAEVRENIIGTTTIEAYQAIEAEAFLAQDRQALSEGYAETLETIEFPDGETRILSTKKVRFYDAAGEAFILGIGRDITQQERLIQQLERSNSDLEEFSHIASHDLKEPLRGIYSQASFLLEDSLEHFNEKERYRIDRIKLLAKRAQELVSHLLYYSRLGRARLAIQPTDLNQVVLRVREMVVGDSVESITINISTPLPTLCCDTVRVEEVFRNLISNAIKYNHHREKNITIGVMDPDKSPDGRRYQSPILFVQDNGIGIKEEYFNSIFQLFHRLHGHDDYGGGTGFGLTFVKKVIETHGGHIWLTSTEGEGSTFYFTLAKF